MIFLRSLEQLQELFINAFKTVYTESEAKKIADFVVNGSGDAMDIIDLAKAKRGEEFDKNTFGELSQVVFQLNDYKFVLKNYVEFLLAGFQFESVCSFVNRLFVSNVGNFTYKSVQKQYSLSERYFDRFVEIIKYCNIADELLMPFFIEILKADASSLCYNYKSPLKEYLKLYMQTAHEKLFAYVTKEKIYDCFEYLLEADTNKTLKFIIEGYIDGSLDCAGVIKTYITKYKQESFNLLEGYCHSSNEEVSYKAIGLLLLFKGDWGVDNFLNGIYEKNPSLRVKKIVSKELEIDKFNKFESQEAYVNEVLKQVPLVQERLYGLRLRRYYEQNELTEEFENKSATFMMETFKTLSNETLLRYMPEYFAFATQETKERIASVVYSVACDREKLNGSKWALRLIACFGNKLLLDKMYDVVTTWLKTLKNSDADYFFRCLALCKRAEIIEFVKLLRQDKSIEAKKLKKIEKALDIYCEVSGKSYDEVDFLLTPDFGLDGNGERNFDLGRRIVKIMLDKDCSVKVFNAETGKVGRIADDVVCGETNLKEYIKAIEKEVSKQKKKFYSMFLNHVVLSYEDFEKYILKHNLLKIVASNILWGKYKNDRLYETFKIKNSDLKHISGSYMTDTDYSVAQVHPLDLKDNVLAVKNLAGNLLYAQLDIPVFDVNEFSANAVSVDKFNGIFVGANLFITRLEKLTYKINDLGKDFYYNTLIKANEKLNFLTVVEFDRVKLGEEQNFTTTVSSIRFYKLNSMPKDGKNYMLSRGETMPFTAINPRVFSNELALIFKAAENR